ncbi:hypothetical protein Tco_0941134 [Tanacetum coccineum]|uniref:Uncharacterized protein n=1 Tax=Tanacetum coccineum TaxID=301880 RepID=A0ABQ5DQC8_9ASTR
MESSSRVSPKEGKKGQNKIVGYGKQIFFFDTEDENDGLNPTLQYEWILTFKTEKQTRKLIRRTRWRQSNEDNKLLKSTHRYNPDRHHDMDYYPQSSTVENLPLTLESEEHYFASFVYPLLEETRADLASSMEIMYRAPFAKIFHWLKNRIWKRLTTLMSRVDVDDRSRTCKSMIGKLIDGEAKASKHYTLNLLVHEEIECDAQGVWN